MRGATRGHRLQSPWVPPESAYRICFQPLSPSALLRRSCWWRGWLQFILNNGPLRGLHPDDFSSKTRAWSFNGQLLRARRVLPLYGSSELIIGVPDRANKFFQNAPTGFQVSPVGTIGTTSLVILQKIAALGSDLRGRRLAISLSPVWFLMPATKVDWYEGNFSPLAASELTVRQRCRF